jgi:hypothetical protein
MDTAVVRLFNPRMRNETRGESLTQQVERGGGGDSGGSERSASPQATENSINRFLHVSRRVRTAVDGWSSLVRFEFFRDSIYRSYMSAEARAAAVGWKCGAGLFYRLPAATGGVVPRLTLGEFHSLAATSK